MAKFALETHDLCVTYKRRRGGPLLAVDNLSISVEPGEIVGFLGPNGAGKSSTLKALMGFVEPSHGKAEIYGLPAGSVQSRALIGYLPEVAMYYPYLTPLETLRLYGKLQGLSGANLEAEIRNRLTQVGIKHAWNRQNRTLSKGMLQRVGIAQALLGEPKLLILDEVTSGLDPIGRRELRDLLLETRDRGCTLFFSSHELAEVEMLCDRILLIDKGNLIEQRDLTTLKAELREFEVVYRGATNLLDLTRDITSKDWETYHAKFRTKSELMEAIARIHRCEGTVVDLIARESTLEDYFVETIGRAA